MPRTKSAENTTNALAPTTKPRCGAKTRRGTSCGEYPMKGRTRCKLHGGMTPRGADSPHFKHGYYVKNMPRDIVDKMELAEHNGEAHSVRANLQFLETQIKDRLEKLYSGESSDLWRKSKSALRSYKDARSNLFAEEQGSDEWIDKRIIADYALTHLTETLERGDEIFHTFDHVSKLLDQQRRTAETNAKIEKDLGEILTFTQANNYLAAIVHICKEFIPESKYEDFREAMRQIRQR